MPGPTHVVPRRFGGTDGKPPRESSRYERARVASLALQNAICNARTEAAVRDGASFIFRRRNRAYFSSLVGQFFGIFVAVVDLDEQQGHLASDRARRTGWP